jgi:hypothetical protein
MTMRRWMILPVMAVLVFAGSCAKKTPTLNLLV